MSILLKNAPAIHIAPGGSVPVEIPPTAFTFEGFREWTSQEGQFPEKGKIEYILGEIWIDLSPERLGSHSAVREAIGRALGDLVQRLDLGTVIPDGSRVVNVKAELACEPVRSLVPSDAHKESP